MRKISRVGVAAALVLAGVGALVASTVASTTILAGVGACYARVHAPLGAVLDPSQIMTNAKDLPAADVVDYTFVFH